MICARVLLAMQKVVSSNLIRLDIYNSKIDQGDISRMTCFPKGQSKNFAVLNQELMASGIERGEIFKDFHIDVECTVIEDEK